MTTSPVAPGIDARPARLESPVRPRNGERTPLDPQDARRILDAAINILRQGAQLLGTVSAWEYSHRVPVAFDGSIGGHYRHCLDHFSSLLGALDSDLVDYDHRARDPRVEQDPGFALEATRGLCRALEGIDPASLASPVSARCEVSYEHGDAPVTQSTLGRELVYAIAHGIHHYALISVMARLLGARLPANFGVAPSTVAHQEQQQQQQQNTAARG